MINDRENIQLVPTKSIQECLVEPECENGFSETGQEVLQNTAQHIDITDFVQGRLTSDPQQAFLHLLLNFIRAGRKRKCVQTREERGGKERVREGEEGKGRKMKRK